MPRHRVESKSITTRLSLCRVGEAAEDQFAAMKSDRKKPVR
jgi:hypothetical protein